MSAAPDRSFWEGKAVAVTGGAGFLGRPTAEKLEQLGAEVRVIRSAEHNLREPAPAREALSGADVVFHLAANVGGIGYNRRHPGPLARDNLQMGINVFEACRELEVENLVAACSVCAYPMYASVPFREDEIWHGYPEESNAPYGLAKKMLLVFSDTYRREWGLRSCAPVIANLYGPGDNFDLEDSHVIPALIRKYVEAVAAGDDAVTVWGTGTPTREFLFVEDAATALVLAAERYDSSEPVNIGTGVETTIKELAEQIAALTEFEGETVWDDSRPDGQPKRFLDVSRARERIGFEAQTSLEEGLAQTIAGFKAAGAVAS